MEVNGQPPTDEASDHKKAKLDGQKLNNNNAPSRVVHVRNVPADACEADLLHVAVPFGRVTNVLLLKGKGQAFVELESASAAQQMVAFLAANALQPTVRGRHVLVQLSNHKELRTHALLDAASCVLRVVVENMLYSVSLDVLHAVFSRAGKVLRIVTFKKNGAFQALVQFEHAQAAAAAKALLNGQSLFNCACTLRIEFSKLPALSVKFNNDKSRDFTNPALPAGHELLAPDVLLPPAFAHHPLPFLGPLHQAALGALVATSVLLVSNLNEQMTTPDALFTLFGVYGDVTRVKILFNKKDNALVQMAEPAQAQLAIYYLDKVRLFGKQLRVALSKHVAVQMPKEGQPDAGLTKDFSASPLHRFKKPGSKNYQNIYAPSATLHLSNIPATTTEEDLRQAFRQVAGLEAVAFKFFPKDRRMALLQLASVDDAVAGLVQMHNHQLSESSHLRVSFSKSSI